MSAYLDTFNLGDVVPALVLLAKRHGCVICSKKRSWLSGPQCLAMRDHMQVRSNALLRAKQSFETFMPDKDIFPPNLMKILSNVESKGVIPSALVQVN